MTIYTSDESFIDDDRLRIGEEEVTFTVVVSEDTTEVYIQPTKAYVESLILYFAKSLDKEKHTR